MNQQKYIVIIFKTNIKTVFSFDFILNSFGEKNTIIYQLNESIKMHFCFVSSNLNCIF